MKLSFRQRIFLYFLAIFAVFAICVIIAERKEEKKYRVQEITSRLDGYSDLIDNFIKSNQKQGENIADVQHLINILPNDIRVSVIDMSGDVVYDKDENIAKLSDNHLSRPEIKSAQYQGIGTNIRHSASTKQEYLYYAKRYDNHFVRVALPYNLKTKALLQPDNLFLYVVIALFIGVLILLNYVAGRFGKSIAKLKSYTTLIKEDKPLPNQLQFPDDELGEIGSELVHIVSQKEKAKKDIELQREKLIRHFRFAEEGLAVFTADYKKSFANVHFLRFANFLVDKPILDVDDIFKYDVFSPIVFYLELEKKEHNHDSLQINKNGKSFQLQTIVYEDKTFEISIKDITRIERNRILKQEITSNIAHELRTPITSMRAYLETLSDLEVPADKQKKFIDRALQQAVRLSNLIDDVSLISRIEDSGSQFTMENIRLAEVINEVRIDLTERLVNNNTKLNIDIDDKLQLRGNNTLLYSIFANLIDNTLNYTTEGVDIYITSRSLDSESIHITYYDTGSGIEEQHLNRLFERFYRISEGRTRNTGGSGLGLSIVRNAVRFHGGDIYAKNRAEGGLEFTFSLKKS